MYICSNPLKVFVKSVCNSDHMLQKNRGQHFTSSHRPCNDTLQYCAQLGTRNVPCIDLKNK